MEAHDTPKFSGAHRRWSRPAGELSRPHVICGILVVSAAFVLFIAVVAMVARG
jgi:hypothetical protein